MDQSALGKSELEKALKSLENWDYQKDRLTKTFKFADFREAIAFIVEISFHADHIDHHPILYNVYNQVRIELTTHSVGNKVTHLDVVLARAIDQVASK
ncbi:MAG: 4a-hydroxytetrahydrobiopterin dehydratase [Bacteroidetes bacterium]|nr:4a-hydroxytetrahydrobiopterin dehydratase [Bacteroidota bacterium]MCY4204928.1 4a-hydroxytetrahydrobiopterin dehydratase [Bacteroidota bacterium]